VHSNSKTNLVNGVRWSATYLKGWAATFAVVLQLMVPCVTDPTKLLTSSPVRDEEENEFAAESETLIDFLITRQWSTQVHATSTNSISHLACASR